MENISKLRNICHELLQLCLRGLPWSEGQLQEALAVDGGRAFMSIVVEHLADSFDPRLCAIYDALFTKAIQLTAPELIPRIRGIQTPGMAPSQTDRVFVLSRITLGADVAVTSVLMAAAKQKYPAAQIIFVGPRKSYELFETDSRISHMPAPYARGGSFAERMKASADLWLPDGLVIDPDSRLTQLGIISVCDESRYLRFPSRSYGAETTASLPELAARWAGEVLGVKGAKPYVAPLKSKDAPADVTVSLGVGENTAKRCDDAFERQLLHTVAATGVSIVVDLGSDIDEHTRVVRALPSGVRTHSGSFASFASLISQSKLFVGYDSAGGHVASACGVRLISIAKGFVNQRMAARWRPDGVVIDGNAQNALEQIRANLF